jgi:hypothetical protein
VKNKCAVRAPFKVKAEFDIEWGLGIDAAGDHRLMSRSGLRSSPGDGARLVFESEVARAQARACAASRGLGHEERRDCATVRNAAFKNRAPSRFQTEFWSRVHALRVSLQEKNRALHTTPALIPHLGRRTSRDGGARSSSTSAETTL